MPTSKEKKGINFIALLFEIKSREDQDKVCEVYKKTPLNCDCFLPKEIISEEKIVFEGL